MKRLLTLLFLAMIATGCTSSYTFTRPVGQNPPPPLRSDGSALVALPANGRYGETVYESSGAATGQAVTAAFSSQLARVECGATVESSAAGLARATEGKFTYFIEPTILHWEDRSTEWSGRSDVMILKLVIYETGTQAVVDSVTIEGKSKWATFGGDHPQDLLRDPLKKYVSQIFGGNTKP